MKRQKKNVQDTPSKEKIVLNKVMLVNISQLNVTMTSTILLDMVKNVSINMTYVAIQNSLPLLLSYSIMSKDISILWNSFVFTFLEGHGSYRVPGDVIQLYTVYCVV